jgi:type VI secretion system protein ImpA
VSLNHQLYFQPVSDDDPCGEDLWIDRYYSQLADLLEMIVGRGPGIYGDAIPGTGDWSKISEEADKGIAQTKHLGLVRYAILADLHRSGLSGLVDGLQVINFFLTEYWEHLHPRPDEGDYDDRLDEIRLLEDPHIIAAIGEIPISGEGLAGGPYTLDEALKAEAADAGESASEEDSETGHSANVLTETILEASINETLVKDPDFYQGLRDEVAEIRELLAATLEAISAQLSGASLSFPAIEGRLKEVERVVGKVVAAGDDLGGEGGDGPPIGGQPAQGLGEIRNRNDVLRVLAKISEYYRKTEPTSPVAVMLERTKRVVMMDFMEIVTEFGLDGTPPIRQVFGVSENNGQDSTNS